jgi:hypothetical protein
LARGFETEHDFEDALDLEDARLEGEIERITEDDRYESFPHRHHAYRRRGQYVEQLERVFTWFARDQVHVMDSESFFVDPGLEYDRLIEFLRLDPHTPERFIQHNARPSSPMPSAARERLRQHYEPYDLRLEKLLDRPLAWRMCS